jgi:hypothetical protein
MAHLPEGNRPAALDVLAANPQAELSIERRLPAYREIIAGVRRTHAEVNRRTEQARQINLRYEAERQRIERGERIATMRQAPAPAEALRLDFTRVQSQRMGMGI